LKIGLIEKSNPMYELRTNLLIASERKRGRRNALRVLPNKVQRFSGQPLTYQSTHGRGVNNMPTIDRDPINARLTNPLRDGRWDAVDPVCNATQDLVDAVNAVQAAHNRWAYDSGLDVDQIDQAIDQALAARAEAIKALVEAQADYEAADRFCRGADGHPKPRQRGVIERHNQGRKRND
jgi:NACalpha-BTF3-like transcription factor